MIHKGANDDGEEDTVKIYNYNVKFVCIHLVQKNKK